MAKNKVVNNKEIKERTGKYIKSIVDGVPNGGKIKFYKCIHVERAELPARINIYLGETKRMLLCKVCACTAKTTIDLFLESDFQITTARNAAEFYNSMIEHQKKKWWQRIKIWSK